MRWKKPVISAQYDILTGKPWDSRVFCPQKKKKEKNTQGPAAVRPA